MTDPAKWHEWFAWRPVIANDEGVRRLVWGEYVWRRMRERTEYELMDPDNTP